MKQICLFVLTFFFATSMNAQDWSGFYKLNVDQDGYEATLQAQIYPLNGEVWGTLRGQDNGDSKERWEIEFWTIIYEDENTIACYYDQGNDGKFPINNALLFSLVGNKADFSSTFGGALMNVIQKLELHEGFRLDNNADAKVDEFTSTIYVAPEDDAPAKPELSAPTKPTTTAAATTTPTLSVQQSMTELIIGSWKGEDASDMTKFFDYDFHLDGSGRRGNTDFSWTYVNEAAKNYIDIQFYNPITRSTYQNYLAKVDGTMEMRDDVNIINTTDGEKHSIKIMGNNYLELTDTKRFKIDDIDNNSLELSFKYNGKTVKTLHYKN